jgi:hypothetical protein
MLFRAKGSHGIDVRGAKGGKECCRQGDRDDDAGDGTIRQRIGGGEVKEHRFDEAARGKRDGNAAGRRSSAAVSVRPRIAGTPSAA